MIEYGLEECNKGLDGGYVKGQGAHRTRSRSTRPLLGGRARLNSYDLASQCLTVSGLWRGGVGWPETGGAGPGWVVGAGRGCVGFGWGGLGRGAECLSLLAARWLPPKPLHGVADPAIG